jgi:hypothetical protein
LKDVNLATIQVVQVDQDLRNSEAAILAAGQPSSVMQRPPDNNNSIILPSVFFDKYCPWREFQLCLSQDDLVLPGLMVPFTIVMGAKFIHGYPQRRFTEADHPV